METFLAWVRRMAPRLSNQITASIVFAPAGVEFWSEQINAMLVGTRFEPLGYNIERRVRDFERLARLNVWIAMVADKLPWSNPIRAHEEERRVDTKDNIEPGQNRRRQADPADLHPSRPFDIGRDFHPG